MNNVLYYNKPKTYSLQELLNFTYVQFNFDFFSTKDTKLIIDELQSLLNKTVIATNQYIEPTYNTAILYKEYNASLSKYKLCLAFQNYSTIQPLLQPILQHINTTYTLNDNCKLQIGLKFDNKHLQTINTISNMDISKLILRIDEKYITNLFPEFLNSPYSFSVKHLQPNNFNTKEHHIQNMKNDFVLPINNYYAIDFTHQIYGILYFNYTIGKNYSAKQQEILDLLFYYIVTTYKCLNENSYTIEDENEFNKIITNYNKLRRCYFDSEYFFNNYKDIKVGIDINISYEQLKTYWGIIKDKLFKIILEANITKGIINFDSQYNRLQLKDIELKNAILDDVDIVSCNMNNCIITDCYIKGCNINYSIINTSFCISNNNLKDCDMKEVRIDRDNKVENSFISNDNEVINCVLINTIVKNAIIGQNAKLNNSVVVSKKDNEIVMNNGIDVKEVRDYKWIASMNKDRKEGHVYGNEFKNNW